MSDISSPLHHPMSDDEDTRMMGDTHTPDPSERAQHQRPRPRPSHASQAAAAAAAAMANQSIGKIRHLKKEDGEPLWRKDIQHDFLKAVFDNDAKVFNNSYEPREKQNFADLYIDTMSRSSKTSKVLRDKLLSDREAAKGMAMVCLLVNIGRMNTTLNFFPEMRAQLRTYHAIPSLQAHQDPHAYKQLQDAPRLKSILKGGAEDRPEPSTLDSIKAANIPRTNPVNLIFVVCQSAAKIAELHFPPGTEFHDLVMKTSMTSESRSKAFLWLMWFYLESDFTEEGCEENPFGAGVDYGVDVANQGVPRMLEMSSDDEAAENVDPQEEIEFGRAKQKTRAKILEADQVALSLVETQQPKRQRQRHGGQEDGVSASSLPRIRPSKHESDMESTRSTPPRSMGGRGAMVGSSRRGGGLKYQVFDMSSPAGPSASHGPSECIVGRKPRPPTAHQIAVERNRTQRVEYILDKGLRKKHREMRKKRHKEGAIIRAIKRARAMPDPFEDSGGEEVKMDGAPAAGSGPFRSKGYGGIAQLKEEEDDYGEEASAYSAALRRASRRLDRWEAHEGADLGIIQPIKRHPVKRRKLQSRRDIEEDEMEGMDLDDLVANHLGARDLENDQDLDPYQDHDLNHRHNDLHNHNLDVDVDSNRGHHVREEHIPPPMSSFLAAPELSPTKNMGKTNGHKDDELDDMDMELLGMVPSSGPKSVDMDVDQTVLTTMGDDTDME